MTEDQKKPLEQQLSNVANTLQGKMHSDGYRDYILGFVKAFTLTLVSRKG